MGTTIRIDKETFGDTAISEHQFRVLSRIFEKLKNSQSEIEVSFELDVQEKSYSSFIKILKKDVQYELPFISKNNRNFQIDNMIIPEKFLLNGENIIYLFDLIFQTFDDKITVKKTIENLRLFDVKSEQED